MISTSLLQGKGSLCSSRRPRGFYNVILHICSQPANQVTISQGCGLKPCQSHYPIVAMARMQYFRHWTQTPSRCIGEPKPFVFLPCSLAKRGALMQEVHSRTCRSNRKTSSCAGQCTLFLRFQRDLSHAQFSRSLTIRRPSGDNRVMSTALVGH